MNLYVCLIEKCTVLRAFNRNRQLIDFASDMAKFDDKYVLKLVNCETKRETQSVKSVCKYFDCDGDLVFDNFQKDLLKQLKKVT